MQMDQQKEKMMRTLVVVYMFVAVEYFELSKMRCMLFQHHDITVSPLPLPSLTPMHLHRDLDSDMHPHRYRSSS
jgi:hypothetical protein